MFSHYLAIAADVMRPWSIKRHSADDLAHIKKVVRMVERWVASGSRSALPLQFAPAGVAYPPIVAGLAHTHLRAKPADVTGQFTVIARVEEPVGVLKPVSAARILRSGPTTVWDAHDLTATLEHASMARSLPREQTVRPTIHKPDWRSV